MDTTELLYAMEMMTIKLELMALKIDALAIKVDDIIDRLEALERLSRNYIKQPDPDAAARCANPHNTQPESKTDG